MHGYNTHTNRLTFYYQLTTALGEALMSKSSSIFEYVKLLKFYIKNIFNQGL